MQGNDFQRGVPEGVINTVTEHAAELREMRARWDAVIPTLATRVQLEQLRGEMKEGFGELRAEIHQTVGNAMRWSIGINIAAVAAMAAFVTATVPAMVARAQTTRSVMALASAAPVDPAPADAPHEP